MVLRTWTLDVAGQRRSPGAHRSDPDVRNGRWVARRRRRVKRGQPRLLTVDRQSVSGFARRDWIVWWVGSRRSSGPWRTSSASRRRASWWPRSTAATGTCSRGCWLTRRARRTAPRAARHGCTIGPRAMGKLFATQALAIAVGSLAYHTRQVASDPPPSASSTAARDLFGSPRCRDSETFRFSTTFET